MGTYLSGFVKCPFYRRDESKTGSLTCEGVLPGSTLKSHFCNRDELEAQIWKYCAGDYRKCPWYRAVMIQYE